MSSEQLLTEAVSTDDNIISMIDDHNSQLILELINSYLQKSYLDSSYSCSFWKIEEIYVISNEILEANYREKSAELKASHEDLYPTTLFTCYRTHNCLKDIAAHGLSTKLTGFNILGDNSKGVTLCQHADIQLKAAEVRPTRCFLFLFSCMSSRIARIDCCDKGKNNRCPVSNYDCHVSSIRPSLNDSLLVQAVRAQIYFYDVNESGSYFNHPRQCLPLACVVYTKSQFAESAAPVPVKHFDVRRPVLPAEAVVDLTGSDETIALLDEAKGAIIYNRLRRYLRKATSSEDIYSLSNYFPKAVDDRNSSAVVSSSSDKDASWHRIVHHSSLQPTMADTASTLGVTTNGVGEESAVPVTEQDNSTLSLRETMSQFCVKKILKNPSSASLVAVSNAESSALGIIIAANSVASTAGTTSQPNTVSSSSRGPTTAANTVSWGKIAPNVQGVTAKAMPSVLGTSVLRTVNPMSLNLKGVGAISQTNSRASFNSTAAHRPIVGQASQSQCPRLVRYLPRILRPPAGLGGIRPLSNSSASTVTVSLPVTSSRTVSSAMPKWQASNIVPVVTRPTTMASLPAPSCLGGSNVRPDNHLSLITRGTRPQSVAMMITMPSSVSGGSNIRPTNTFDATQLIPQWQAISPHSPFPLQAIPLYTDCSDVNLLSQHSNRGPQAQLMRPAAASQSVSLAGTPRTPAGMVSLNSPQPYIFHIPANLAQFTVTRSADQLRLSVPTAAAASENNLFFGGRGVEDVTIDDEGLVINGVQPIVIMPDGTCDEDEGQNCSLADGVQGSAVTDAIDKVSDCDLGILKIEEKSTRSKVRNQKSHTIILDADLPINEGESISNALMESPVLRLVDQEVDEDGDLLDRQLRISDVVSLQSECDENDSSMVHRRLLGELWMEKTNELDSIRPAETSLSSSNCKIISLASAEVKNAPYVSELLSLDQGEIVHVESKTAMSAADKPIQGPVEDFVVHSMASVGLMASSSQMQHDAQALENRVGETRATEKELANTDDSSIQCGSQAEHKTLLETLLLEPPSKKQKPKTNAKLSTGVCLPASKESSSTIKKVGKTAKQRQTIPVFTVCADGSVSIRLDDETERVDDNMQNAGHCDVRIELLRDIEEKDTLLKALAKVLGNVHVTDLRHSSDEIIHGSQTKNTEDITSSSLNLNRNNVTKVNGVEERTRLAQDSLVSHKSAKPDGDNEAGDTNILIESVHSMCLEKFDEIGVSSGDARSADPLPSKKLSSQNDEEDSLQGLDDLMIHTSRDNSVGSMNTSDFEENDVEDDEPFQMCEDETQKFSVGEPQSSQGLRQQSASSDVTCSAESGKANLNIDVCGTENVRQLTTKSQCSRNSPFEQLPLGSKNGSEIYKLNGLPPLDSTDKSEMSRTLNKEVVFQSENSGLNEELASKESQSVGVHEDEHDRACEEPCVDSDVESEMSRLQTKSPLSSVNMSEPYKVVEQVPVLLDSALETCRMNEQPLKDVVNESETCSMNEKQPMDLEIESETCIINNKQSLLLENEPEMLRLNLELPVDSTNALNSLQKSKELHFHVTNECDVGLAKEPETCRLHEEQQLDLTSSSESCKTHEEQHLDMPIESESCETHEEQHLNFATESESCRTREKHHLDLENESDTSGMHEELQFESSRIHDGQQLDITIESELCKASEEQHLDVASESELYKTSEEHHLDLESESELYKTSEEHHLDLTSETLLIDRQPSSETANEADSSCEKPLLKLANQLPITRTLRESLLNLAIQWRESGVNENFRMANAAKSVHSNLKTSESLQLGCFDSITPEAISPFAPACSSGVTSSTNVSETISSAFVTETTSSACITEAISPTYDTEAISPISETEAISPISETEAISPTYEPRAISPTYEPRAISPTYEPRAISPISETEAISPTYVIEAISPICETEVISPICETEAISPIYVTEAISPTYITEAISPICETEAISPIYETETISPAYETVAISPAYIMEPISPALVTEPISPPVCIDTYRPVTENVSPPSYAQGAPLAHAVTGVQETRSVITSDGSLRSSACQQNGSEMNFDDPCSSKNDASNTGIAVFHLANKYFLESVKKSAEVDSKTSHQTSYASEMNAVTKQKKVFSLEEYKMSKLNRSKREVENPSNLRATETQAQSLNTSSLHLDKHQLDDQERDSWAKRSYCSQSVAFSSPRTEVEPNDQLNMMNSGLSLDFKLSQKVMERSNSAVINSIRQRDPRLQDRDCAFKDAEAPWNNAPIEIEKDKELNEARVHMMAQKQLKDFDKDLVDVDQLVDYDEDMYVDTQQQLSNPLAIEEEEESSGKNMDKLLNDKAIEELNRMARELKDRLKLELITGAEEQENSVRWGCKLNDEESGSNGREPGEIEDERCLSTAEVDVEQVVDKQVDDKQVVDKQVVEVLDDWDECGDFVIVGSSLDILSDDDKESGEVTSDSSDEFGDLVRDDDGADGEDEYDCNLQQRQSLDGETDQESVWHLLDDALSVRGQCEHEDDTQAVLTHQHKSRNKKVQKKNPVIIKLKAAKLFPQDDRVHRKDDSQENAGAGLKWNSDRIKVSEKCHSHHGHNRRRKSGTKMGCRSHKTRRNNPADICEFPSTAQLMISDERHKYHQPTEDQSPSYQWDIYQGASGESSRERRDCSRIDIEIIKVLRNIDDISAERSVFGGADSFVTLLMNEFQHLPEESQRYYNECVRQTLQEDKEFVTSEHIYGSMAELLTEEQRQHIQRTHISPIVALEIHLEDILKKVKLELGDNKSDSDSDLSHHNLLVLTKEMLYDQLNDLKCYQKSRSVFVLPDEFRLTRETGKYISVDGSLLFICKSTLSVKMCCRLYCYRTEIEEMEDELNESLRDAGGLTEEICRKLSVLYLKRRHCLHNIGCSADQLDALKKKFSRNLSWFRRMRDILQSRDQNKDGQEMALINCLNQRIEKLQEYIKAITSLKNVSGTWYPHNNERTEL